jgi:hypothetical protein
MGVTRHHLSDYVRGTSALATMGCLSSLQTSCRFLHFAVLACARWRRWDDET